mgnify:CR=1 FL=1
MRIKSLKLVNFRAFHGEQHEIEFAHEDDQNLTLILAENEVDGTGGSGTFVTPGQPFTIFGGLHFRF